MSALGSEGIPLRVAVVGAGPAGFYATEALQRAEVEAKVDIFERLAAPYGLVRSGVAPDHPKLKNAIRVYHQIAQSADVAFLGNVTVGQDLSLEEMSQHYHAVIFCYGAESDRRLGIPGEDLPGSHTATEFVGWYNGHPDYRDHQFDLSCETAAIIGQGNVALDVARILSKTVDELKFTDIAQHALDSLAESRVRDIHIIGRRGPAQAKFSRAELAEFAHLEDCSAVVDPEDLHLNPASAAERDDREGRGIGKNLELLQSFTEPKQGKKRQVYFRFLLSPKAIEGKERVTRLLLEKNRLEGKAFQQRAIGTGETLPIDCGLVFRSIGYLGQPVPGLPFDPGKGIVPNRQGRVVMDDELPADVYVAGWIKRGPTGKIGTNRADAVETVETLLSHLADLSQEPKEGAAGLSSLLEERGVRVVSYPDWLTLDAVEVDRGKPLGKPREKLTRTSEKLSLLE